MKPVRPREIREFVRKNGTSPYREWLKSLDIAARVRVQARILRFESGNLGDYKSVGKGVYEARLNFGPGFRVYFGFEGDRIILLLIGGQKEANVEISSLLNSFGMRSLGMTRRSRDWNEGLAEDLRDPKFAHEFVIAALDEGISLQVVVGKIVRAYGVKEYAEKLGMASSNVLRAINPNYNPTQKTLNRLLEPLDLQLTVGPLKKTAA